MNSVDIKGGENRLHQISCTPLTLYIKNFWFIFYLVYGAKRVR